jgi:hypothetical protein
LKVHCTIRRGDLTDDRAVGDADQSIGLSGASRLRGRRGMTRAAILPIKLAQPLLGRLQIGWVIVVHGVLVVTDQRQVVQLLHQLSMRDLVRGPHERIAMALPGREMRGGEGARTRRPDEWK